MSRVDELAEELAKAILESEEYQNYLRAMAEVKKNPQLYQAINEVRKRSFELQNSANSDIYNENKAVDQQYAYLRTNEVALNFLRCEIGVCRMMQDVERTLVEDIDLELDFL
ncbi:MAG: YlbF family regulator [Lachnospiraceae bacterium]|nr:YlbF family regulator [Lachnospiraceae bacterium]